MSRPTSEFREGYLWGRSFDSVHAGNLLQIVPDLSIVATSWDARCLAITEASAFKSTLTCLLEFDVRDSAGLRQRHDPLLREYCRSHSDRVALIQGPSTQLSVLWNRLRQEIWQVYRTLQRPLWLFIDVSACPRYYALAAVATCLGGGLASRVSIFYAEGQYPEPDREPEIAFTGERWQSVAVPGLEGSCDPEKQRFYLVAVGFEGWKTLRAVAQADPDRVSILFPSPGTRPGYEDRTRNDNEPLFREFRIPHSQIVKAPAGDAIAAWQALSEAALERPDSENTSFLCCGTKPHAIGLGLRALAAGYPAVLYNLPDQHKVVATEPSGRYWRFDIMDVTTPLPRTDL